MAWLRRKRPPARFARTGFAETTLAELAWQRTRTSAHRWGAVGAVLGALAALVAYLPAGWLAGAIATASAQRVLLTDARGTLWRGSALLVLTGGEGSRDATALPDRLEWRLGLSGLKPELRLRQACCLRGEVRALISPGWGRVAVQVQPDQGTTIGQWPAALLAGLGTPWNTMQMGGTLRLTSPGMTIESVQGRMRFAGDAALDIAHASSRVSTLDTLGSYRLTLHGDAGSGDGARMELITVDGALRLSGSGQWAGSGLRFRGEATAAEGSEPALNNLLNIIGRRQGARSVISIG
ncbi:MAG TPA: type II secretion system protein N [Burkholderiaceae bacterium]|jgi:general secretion pathway protein N|nr:type II secretion system protein N [Burkholderiaceae bacterium]